MNCKSGYFNIGTILFWVRNRMWNKKCDGETLCRWSVSFLFYREIFCTLKFQRNFSYKIKIFRSEYILKCFYNYTCKGKGWEYGFDPSICIETEEMRKEEDVIMKKNKKTLLAVVVFALVIVVLGGIYYFTRPETKQGEKQVEITVVNKAGEETAYEVKTDAEYLLGAMEDAEELGLTFEGAEGDYGLMIDTVNGETAVYAEDGAYWGFSLNGTYCEYGVSEQPVADEFEIKYTIGE